MLEQVKPDDEEDRACDRRARPRPLEPFDGPHAGGDRADESRLEGPEQVLVSASQEQDENPGGESRDWAVSAADQLEHPRSDDDVNDEQLDQEREVRVQARDLERRAVCEERQCRPMLVVWREPGRRIADVRPSDEAPLVLPERELVSDREEHGNGQDGRGGECRPRASRCDLRRAIERVLNANGRAGLAHVSAIAASGVTRGRAREAADRSPPGTAP